MKSLRLEYLENMSAVGYLIYLNLINYGNVKIKEL